MFFKKLSLVVEGAYNTRQGTRNPKLKDGFDSPLILA